MNIPSRFNTLLTKDSRLHSLVLQAITSIEPWASDNKTVFFPEYTDHSLKHLEEVLLTAEGLILDEAWPHLTATDATVMILSVLLHDCALHLSEEGFYCLISGNYPRCVSRYVGEETDWSTLWRQFYAEAKRFDQRRLTALFGESSPINPIPENKLELTYKHRLLIGEFLRRHHARLAHEIALSGIPASNEVRITDSTNNDILDLAGFVARSHNMSLRSAVDKLEPQKKRVHLNCKVPFIMATLRLADYLQIHAARAPGELLQLKSLASPVSRGEWQKHVSVQEINQAHDDPEAIFVDANPRSAKTFLAMTRLLTDIQKELDQCWAVLGEVYGRFAPLNALGVGIRRIRSNLDNPASFQRERTPSYIPRDFKFRTASAELMDLLVAPLYGSKPEIGIRELIQNAVDACMERNDLITRGAVSETVKSKDDVVVYFKKDEDGNSTLVIEDYGVGMTPDIVDRYFLNVGASFRSSDLWRKNHENDGHSTVHRTGRFGIGLLAAFLLGSEIKVTTRHINAPAESAITFSCTQGDESLEVAYSSLHHGTKIEIALSKETAEVLLEDPEKWDWYCMKIPTVRRLSPSPGEADLPQELVVPSCDENLEGTPWRRLTADGFDDVLWSYEIHDRWGQRSSIVICNGIYVCRYRRDGNPDISRPLGIISPSSPSLVVYDPNGRFPINLQRDEVSSKHISFRQELATAVSDYIAKGLVDLFDRVTPEISSENISLSCHPKIPALENTNYPYTRPATMIITQHGFVPADAHLMRQAGIRSLFLDATNLSVDRGAYKSRTITNWIDNYCAVPSVTHTKSSRSEFLRRTIGDTNHYGEMGYFRGIDIVGKRILVRNADVVELVRPGNVSKRLWSRLSIEQEIGNWTLYRMGEVPTITLDLAQAITELEEHSAFGFSLLYFKFDPEAAEKCDSDISPFATAWMQHVGSSTLRPRHT